MTDNRKKPWHRIPRGDDSLASVIWSHMHACNSFRESRLERVAEIVRVLEREEWGIETAGHRDGAVTETSPPPADDASRLTGATSESPGRHRASYNKLRMDLSALSALIFRDPPDIQVSDVNGKYEQEQRVAKVNAAIDACMNNEIAGQDLAAPSNDGLNLGWGGTFPEVASGVVHYRRVREHQLLWDPIEAQYRAPRTLHYWVRLDRAEIIGMVEEWDSGDGLSARRKADVLRKLDAMPAIEHGMEPAGSGEALTPYQVALQSETGLSSDCLVLSYTWRVARREGMEKPDGRYVVCAHGGGARATEYGDPDGTAHLVLWDAPYKRTRTPIVWWTPDAPYEGITCPGLGQTLLPFQSQIDWLWGVMDEDIRQLARAKLMVADSVYADVLPNVKDAGLNVIRMPDKAFMGTQMYEIVPGNPLSPQLIELLDRVDQTSTRAIGSNEGVQQGGSQLGAAASGRALLVEDDRTIGRFAAIESRWYVFRMMVAIATLDALDDAAERDKEFLVQLRGARAGESYRWSELRLPREEYNVRIEERGVLARRLPGRVAQLQELADRGIVPPDEASAEIGSSADLRGLFKRAHAARRLVESQLARLQEEGKDADYYGEAMPDKQTPADLAQQMGLAEYQRAKTAGASEPTLNRLLDYLTRLAKLSAEQAPPASPAPAAGPPGMEMAAAGMGMAPPGAEIPPMGGELPPELTGVL